MRTWLKALGGALRMGLCWMFVAANIALLIEGSIDPDGKIVDVWIAALGYPALAGGILFSLILSVAEPRRRLADIPLTRAAAWGALSGVGVVLVGALLVAISVGNNPPGETTVGTRPFLTLLVAGTVGAVAVSGWATVAIMKWMAPGLAMARGQ